MKKASNPPPSSTRPAPPAGPPKKASELLAEYAKPFDQACIKVIELEQKYDQAVRDFNAAIDFAIEDTEPRAFLTAWREGDWETIRKEWPEFVLPLSADEYTDPWLPLIDQYLLNTDVTNPTTDDIYHATIGKDEPTPNIYACRRINIIMQQLGWVQKIIWPSYAVHAFRAWEKVTP